MRYRAPALVACLILLASLPLVGVLRAQSPSVQQDEPKTVNDCLNTARSYVGKKYQEMRAAGETPNIAKLNQEATDLAKRYAARFSLASVSRDDLPTLARLYALARQPDLANAAIEKALGAPGTTNAEKAEGLSAAIEITMGVAVNEESLASAERYCAQLDALPGVTAAKIGAHVRLGGYYRAVDVDDRIFAHGNKVIELARGLTAGERGTVSTASLASAYANVAEVYGGWEQADKAVAVLEQGLNELAGTAADVRRIIEPTLERYRLVRTAGAAVEAPNWLNAPAGTTKIDVKGTVSIIQFTAHWCGPCRKSYPAILRLHNTWTPKGLQLIFATELYGFLGTERSLTPAQEIQADRKYFVEEHGLPFKIAIEPQRQAQQQGAASTVRTNSDRYKVGGIPQIVVTDKQGKIRLIIVGWDPAAEARLNKLVERLLAEKTVP